MCSLHVEGHAILVGNRSRDGVKKFTFKNVLPDDKAEVKHMENINLLQLYHE